MKVNYERAKKIALETIGEINACREFEKAYHFYDKNKDTDGEFGIVILKENGKKLNWVNFILNYHPEKNPKELEYK